MKTEDKISDPSKLENCDDEDVFDVVAKLERSFGLNFLKDAFTNIKTFGDLCDVFEHYLNAEEQNDCTSQRAFYKIRKAINATQQINEREILPDSRLSDLFPQPHRRQKIKTFQNILGIRVELLDWPDWLVGVLVIGIFLSFIAFFFNAWLAVSGVLFFCLAMWVGGKAGTSLKLETIRELAEKLTRENYTDVRSAGKAINRKEAMSIIVDTFSKELDVDAAYLTRDAKFSWG